MELLIVPAGSINAPEIWNEIDSSPVSGNSTSSKASGKLVQGYGTKRQTTVLQKNSLFLYWIPFAGKLSTSIPGNIGRGDGRAGR
jgi:hypothetical protein